MPGTIGHYANATAQLSSMSAILAALEFEFTKVSPRTDLDVQHLDLLIAQADELTAAAENLKAVSFNPDPETLDAAD